VKIASSLLLLIGALAVLTLGALGVSAAPAMAEAPCHEMSHETTSTDPAPNRPAKAMKAMACCVACVAAPALPPATHPGAAVAPDRLRAPLLDLPTGRRPSPEPGPPRLPIA
jgi:hypothetical protein